MIGEELNAWRLDNGRVDNKKTEGKVWSKKLSIMFRKLSKGVFEIGQRCLGNQAT